MSALNGPCLCDDVGGDGYAFCVACTKRRADARSIVGGPLHKTLAALVEYLDYTGELAGTRDDGCNCPLDANDTQCGICLGRAALARAKELLR